MINRILAFIALAGVAILGPLALRPAGADFAQQGTYGGVSTGAANAQVISLPGVAVLSQLRGVTISFTVGAGLTNSAPATLGINSLSPVAIDRMNSGTLLPLGGAEMPAGKLVEAFYDGTEFVLTTDYTGGAPVGTEAIAAGATAHPGYALEYGQCVVSASNPAIVAYVGTTYNAQDGCPAGQTGLPDKRGRTAFGLDNMGGTAANRITAAGGNFAATTIGATGGQQSKVVTQNNLSNFAFPATSTASSFASVSDPGHTHIYNQASTDGQHEGANGGALFYYQQSASTTGLTVTGIGVSVATTVATSVSTGGNSVPLATLSNAQISIYEIKL